MNKGLFISERFINQAFLSSLQDSSQAYADSQLVYQDDLPIDL